MMPWKLSDGRQRGEGMSDLHVDLRPMLRDLGFNAEQIEHLMAIGPHSFRIERPVTMDEFVTMLVGKGWRIDEDGNIAPEEPE